MGATAIRSTIYLDPDLHQFLKQKAAENNCSISELVNEAVRESLREDDDDLRVVRERAGEPMISSDEMMRLLGEDDKL